MEVWHFDDLKIDVDAVLRGQGASPEKIRSQSPQLVEIAKIALDKCVGLLEPQVLSKQVGIKSLWHNRVELVNGLTLKSPEMAQHLAGADSIMVVLCTIGSKIDYVIADAMKVDKLLGLAIDGVGSAAVEALSNITCRNIELQMKKADLMTTFPLSPGMIGWPVELGQPTIFEILKPDMINVELTRQNIMKPRKSLTMLIGIGPDLDTQGKLCDFCGMTETCKYKELSNHV